MRKAEDGIQQVQYMIDPDTIAAQSHQVRPRKVRPTYKLAKPLELLQLQTVSSNLETPPQQ